LLFSFSLDKKGGKVLWETSPLAWNAIPTLAFLVLLFVSYVVNSKPNVNFLVMSKRSVVGLVGITVLSALMLLFSFLFNQYGESNVSLISLFAGIAMAAVLVLIVLFQKDSENN